ncbi:MAG TPA: glycosyltransferase [Armatimonadota bacterium]|jgi:glycosyltransferase involved in cell wall biosynthesis
MNAPIRIAHVVEATAGGVARHVIDLVTHLDPAAYTNLLYLSFGRADHRAPAFRALAAERELTLREMPMARIPNATVVKELAAWWHRDAVDLVHLHSAKAGYLGRQALAGRALPVVYTPHAFPFQRTTDWRRPLYRMIERRLAARTAKIICVSQGEYEEALAVGLPEEKLTVIANGLDPAAWPVPTPTQRREIRGHYQVPPEALVIGALARLTPQKGIDLLLAAAEEFLPDFPDARVMIWGDGPERRALQRLARRLRVKRVAFYGEASEPWRAYAVMNIFCAPSRWEAGPYAVLEAMACGLPVVASDVPGHADYLEHGESGLLVPADLPGPLDGALRSLLRDTDEREALGEAARRRVAHHFTLERMVAETAAVYRALVPREG